MGSHYCTAPLQHTQRGSCWAWRATGSSRGQAATAPPLSSRKPSCPTRAPTQNVGALEEQRQPRPSVGCVAGLPRSHPSPSVGLLWSKHNPAGHVSKRWAGTLGKAPGYGTEKQTCPGDRPRCPFNLQSLLDPNSSCCPWLTLARPHPSPAALAPPDVPGPHLAFVPAAPSWADTFPDSCMLARFLQDCSDITAREP